MAKEGSSDYKRVRKRWFFKEPLTGSLWNQKWFFYGIAVKNLLSTIFKSVEVQGFLFILNTPEILLFNKHKFILFYEILFYLV